MLAIGRRKTTVSYNIYRFRETGRRRRLRCCSNVFGFPLADPNQYNKNIKLSENTIQGSVFTPSDTNKTANQLAPVDLKGGSPRPQFDKPAEFVENLIKNIIFVKA